MHAKKTNKTKLAVVLLAVVLLIGCTAGATLAWLMDSTTAVVNTFTTSDIDITLTENTGDEYQMIPGATITKDPKVTVEADSEACWLFVKVEENIGEVIVGDKKLTFRDFLDYAIADGWTPVPDETNVYYREVDAATAEAGVEYPVIKDNKVTVKDTVTKAMMNALTDGTLPTLTFTAYAVQAEAATTATAAWALAQDL